MVVVIIIIEYFTLKLKMCIETLYYYIQLSGCCANGFDQ